MERGSWSFVLAVLREITACHCVAKNRVERFACDCSGQQFGSADCRQSVIRITPQAFTTCSQDSLQEHTISSSLRHVVRRRTCGKTSVAFNHGN